VTELHSQPMEESDDAVLLDRMRVLVGRRIEPEEKPRRVRVIINPAAGKDQPILKALNAAMKTAGADWDVSITKEAGDGSRLAREAVEAGVGLVIAHGGDGTVMEVATGLMHSNVPMAIIPGGTANVMAMELGIPGDVVEASALAINPDASIRTVDMGQINDHYFLLRAGMGFEAVMVEGADRELKDRLGILAYVLSGLQALADPPVARYHLSFDGQELDTEGLTCIVANSGTIAAAGILLAPTINVSDGLLDIVVVTKSDLPSLVGLLASVVGGNENTQALQHWQVSEVTIAADPPQSVQADGEIIGKTPITARVIPAAVRVIVPLKGEIPIKIES
jgi:diacylglycerol kinase (ATP)